MSQIDLDDNRILHHPMICTTSICGRAGGKVDRVCSFCGNPEKPHGRRDILN